MLLESIFLDVLVRVRELVFLVPDLVQIITGPQTEELQIRVQVLFAKQTAVRDRIVTTVETRTKDIVSHVRENLRTHITRVLVDSPTRVNTRRVPQTRVTLVTIVIYVEQM